MSMFDIVIKIAFLNSINSGIKSSQFSPFDNCHTSQYKREFFCKYKQDKKYQLFLWFLTQIAHIFPIVTLLTQKKRVTQRFFFFFCTARRAKTLLLCRTVHSLNSSNSIRDWNKCIAFTLYVHSGNSKHI